METAAGCEVGAGLVMVATEQCQWCHSGVCIVDLVCFTASSFVSFLDFEWVIVDCLDMPVLHLNCLTGVNNVFTLI